MDIKIMKEKTRKFLNKLSTRGMTAVVVGILVLINYIFSFFPVRADLTDNKIYSLSPASKKIVSELEDIVNITLYVSDDLPNRLLPALYEVKSLIDSYEQAGGGNIRVKTKNPQTPEEQEDVLRLGVPQLQFSGIEKDKLEVRQGYFGGVLQYGGKSEAIPVFEQGANFEYKFTSLIRKLTREKVPAIAFAEGHAERKDLKSARQLLEQDFTVRDEEVSTASGEIEIGKDTQILLVIGSQKRWEKEEKEFLKDFVEKGNSILFALDGVEVGQGLRAAPAEHNLFDIAEEYGLTLNQDLIISASHEIANFRTEQGLFFTPYPFWVKIQPEGFNKKIPAFAQLGTAVFPWTSSIKVAENQKGKNYELVKTVSRSYTKNENYNLLPNQDFLLDKGTGEKVVAAGAEAGEKGRVALIGDADFLADNSLQRTEANAVFFLNMVDWLSSDDVLSDIRARGSSYRPLAELEEGMKMIVKYTLILAAPLFLGAAGLFRLTKRK